MSSVTSIVFAGLGGQGVLKASDIAAEVAFRAGADVKKSEVHGMSQRGGSVTSDVRFGERVLSPMVPPGEADFLVALSDEEAKFNRWRLRPGGTLVTLPVAGQKTHNVALLGALSRSLPFSEDEWLAAVHAHLPKKVHELNEKAFRAGREAG